MISVSFVCKAQLIHLTLEHPSAFTGIPKSQCRISTGRQDAHETFAGLQSSSKAKAGERIVFVLHAGIHQDLGLRSLCSGRRMPSRMQ